MAPGHKKTQVDSPAKREPKSARQRKEDFEKKQRDAGRLAVIVHLSRDAKNHLAALRRAGRLSKTGPTTNADVIESLLTSATTMAAIEDAQEAIVAAKPRTRGAPAQRAHTLLNKVDDLLVNADLEESVLSLHDVSRFRWSADVARSAMECVRAGATAEDLQWLLYDLIDAYIESLFDYPNLPDGASAEDREALAWIRAQLGLRRD